MLDCENSTGTGKQSVRVRYKYTVNGVEFIGKSEWLNNGVFYPGKIYEVKYHSEKPEKSYLKTIDRVIQGIIGIVFLFLGIGIIMLGFVLTTIIYSGIRSESGHEQSIKNIMRHGIRGTYIDRLRC